MKPTKLKKIVVKCLEWTDEVEVDNEIFDNVYVEAATRVVEKNRNTPNFSVSVVMCCYEKKNEKDPKKHVVCNTYFILVNSGLHDKAELLRLNFLKTYGKDLKNQSVSSYESQPGIEPTQNASNN